MSGSFRIARIAGIDLKIHWTFFVLLLWLAASYAMAGSGVAGAVYGLALLLAVFSCVVLHEFGHALAARQCGVDTLDITLLPIGGIARLERMPSEPRQELWVALAGPLVNVVIAALLFAVLLATGGFEGMIPDELMRANLGVFLANLMWINLILVVFNLIPAFPMDGGRVLRALLAARGNRVRATETAAKVGQAIAVLFGILGLFTNPMLLFVALFVYLGAEAEARAERVNVVLADVPVKSAMLTRFNTMRPLDTLGRAREELLAGSQQDFPVETADGHWGVLHRDDLIAGLRTLGPTVPVSETMRVVERPLHPDEPVQDAIQRMRENHLGAMPVIAEGKLVGLLTTENLGELLMIREAATGFAGSRLDAEEVDRVVTGTRTPA